ncbi:MAG: cytochrome c maturation protein CcmE [Calditrichaeota bacterium]|nr:MAG: cytochrome c maturation protein CcmE [Calditrichota bacterium]
MSKRGYIIGIVIIVVTFGFLVMKGLDKSMMSYVEVSQIVSNPDVAERGGVLQVSGIVQPGSVKTYGGGNLEFTIQDMKNSSLTLPVVYQGIIPDNFKPGLQVVVQGRYSPQTGKITGQKILVKCPSKYEADPEKN